MGPIEEVSPRFMARMVAVFYLLEALTGGVAITIGRRLVVAGDAAATAANILAHQPLFWLGFAGWILQTASYIPLTALLYELFKPVNRRLSLLAAFFSLVGCGILAVACLLYVAPLAILEGGHYLRGFSVEQLQALALLSLRLFNQCFYLSFPFFAFMGILIGYLILRSTFLPRTLGVLMLVGGLAWLTFLAPPIASYLSPWIMLSGLGEASLALWFLVAGVDAERWKEQARAGR